MFRSALPIVFRMSKQPNPPFMQVRNRSWDLRRPFQDIQRVMHEMDRKMADLEHDIFEATPLRKMFPTGTAVALLPVEGAGRKNVPFTKVFKFTGFKPEEIKLALKDGKLRIEGNMERTAKDGSVFKQYALHEFAVSDNLDLSTVKSTLYEDGVLEIEGLLKPEDGKKIAIEGVPENKDGSDSGTKSKL